MKKRILSILLCLCMAACSSPTVAFAAGAENDKAIQLCGQRDCRQYQRRAER